MSTDTEAWSEYARWHDEWIGGHADQVIGQTEMEARNLLDRCLDQYAEIKRKLFIDGFADFVVKKGFGAVTPNKINGKPESWQACGRRLWGKKHFDEAMVRAIERSRGGRTPSRMSPESASP